MSQEFNNFIPNNTPPPAEILQCHQLTFDFRREVQTRDNFKEYCQWYKETAQQHQNELTKMQNDLNFFGWFLKR
jgi:hypothetical protein